MLCLFWSSDVCSSDLYYSCYEFDKSTEMYDKIINTTKSQETKKIALENKEKVLNAQYSK